MESHYHSLQLTLMMFFELGIATHFSGTIRRFSLGAITHERFVLNH